VQRIQVLHGDRHTAIDAYLREGRNYLYDLVLKDGIIIDGTGAPRRKGDIGILKDRIAAVSYEPDSLSGNETIDISGKCVSPGFFDIHSHADRAILMNPYCRSSLSQGITTVIAGNCGSSQGPLSPASKERLIERAKAAGSDAIPDYDWTTLGEFLGRVESAGAGVNIGMFVGQGTVRSFVMGLEDRIPTIEEVSSMRTLVRHAMKEGAFGLSSGRTYVPGRYASAMEVAELCQEIAPWDGLYSCHMKSEGAGIIAAINEVLEISDAAAVRPHIVHAKVVGKPNYGKAKEALAFIEQAREAGRDLLFDVYPWDFAQVSTLRGMLSGLMTKTDIGRILLELRKNPSYEEAVSEEAIANMKTADPVRVQSLPERGVIWCQNTKEFEGKSILEIATILGKDIVPTIVWLGIKNHFAVKTAYTMDPREVGMFLSHPFSMISTDAPTTDSVDDRSGSTHPRAFGTYPRVLGHYVREEGILSLEEAVGKMTLTPARRAGVTDRGRIKQGYYADLVVFDKDTVGSPATIEAPCEKSSGIDYVFVNGHVAVRNGEITGAKQGRVLRS
jgi:N-acyl-D-amino-acid deacylase